MTHKYTNAPTFHLLLGLADHHRAQRTSKVGSMFAFRSTGWSLCIPDSFVKRFDLQPTDDAVTLQDPHIPGFPPSPPPIFFPAFIHRQTDIFFIKFSLPLLIGKVLEVEKRGQRRHFLRVTIKNAELLMLAVQRQ